MASIGKNTKYTAECNKMLKSKPYMAKFNGEWEELDGQVFCLDTNSTSHKLTRG